MYGNGMPTTTVIVDLATAGSAGRQAGFSNTGSQSRVCAQLAAAPYANLNPAAAAYCLLRCIRGCLWDATVVAA